MSWAMNIAVIANCIQHMRRLSAFFIAEVQPELIVALYISHAGFILTVRGHPKAPLSTAAYISKSSVAPVISAKLHGSALARRLGCSHQAGASGHGLALNSHVRATTSSWNIDVILRRVALNQGLRNSINSVSYHYLPSFLIFGHAS